GVDLFDSCYAALAFEPAKGEHGDIYSEHRRGVQHGTIFDMQLVIQYGRDLAGYFTQHALSYGYHGSACGAHILLYAGIDQGEAVKVHLAAENIGAHVRDERYIRFRYRLPL